MISSDIADFLSDGPAVSCRDERAPASRRLETRRRPLMQRRQFLQTSTLGAAAVLLGAAPVSGASQPISSREKVMADEVHAYEPLTSENAALVLIDHQV